jgi:hypothetical protein
VRRHQKGHLSINLTYNPMGYIQDLESELAEMLSELDEEERGKVIKYVKDKVWQSYKNGKAEAGGDGKKNSKRFERKAA